MTTTLNRGDVTKILERAGFKAEHVIRENFKAFEHSDPAVGLRIARSAAEDLVEVARELERHGELEEELPLGDLVNAMQVSYSDEGYDVVYFTGFALSPQVEESTGEPLASEEPVDEDRIEGDVNDPEQTDEQSEQIDEPKPKGLIDALMVALGVKKQTVPADKLPPGVPVGTQGYKIEDIAAAQLKDPSTVFGMIEGLIDAIATAETTSIKLPAPSCGCGADHFPALSECEERLLVLAYGYRETGRARGDKKLVKIGDEMLAAFGIE